MPDSIYENLVKAVQKYLNEQITTLTPLKEDGELGKLTLARAQTYQSKIKDIERNTPPLPTKAEKPNLKDWRLARALTVLRSQINNQWPNRSKESDGTIGDAKHASRKSDHNPWVHDSNDQPVVTALDVTHDPANGVDCTKISAEILNDPRVKYIIWNGRIWNPKEGMKWRKYIGDDPHTKHMHVSVKAEEKLFDNEKPWEIV